jgi:predicted DNA binding CopG/RHH family protein
MKGKNMKNKPATENSETQMLNIRLRKELIKRVKSICAEKEITVQDFVADAIIEKLGLVYKERRKKSRL